uniref:Uncharacterized protein n=1 Tax=Anopheles atroparvus TaxID=41427 RepID=A0A182IU69_ANOAO
MMMLQHLPPSHAFVGSSASSTASAAVSPSPPAPSETPTPPPALTSTPSTASLIPSSPGTDGDQPQPDRVIVRHYRHEHPLRPATSPSRTPTHSESRKSQEDAPVSPASPRHTARPQVVYSDNLTSTRSRSRSRSRSVSPNATTERPRSRTPPERKHVQPERVNVIRYIKEERPCPIIRRRSSLTDAAMDVEGRTVRYTEDLPVEDRRSKEQHRNCMGEGETGNDADVEEEDEAHPRDYYAAARRTSPYRDYPLPGGGSPSYAASTQQLHLPHHHRHSPARHHHKSGSGSSYARSSRDSSSPRRMVTDHEDSDYSESSHVAPGPEVPPRVPEVIRETVVAGPDPSERLRLTDGRYAGQPKSETYDEEEDAEGDAEEEDEEEEEEEEEEEDLDAPLDLSMKIKRRPRSSSVTEDSDDSAGPDYAEHHNRGVESAAYKKSLMKRYPPSVAWSSRERTCHTAGGRIPGILLRFLLRGQQIIRLAAPKLLLMMAGYDHAVPVPVPETLTQPLDPQLLLTALELYVATRIGHHKHSAEQATIIRKSAVSVERVEPPGEALVELVARVVVTFRLVTTPTYCFLLMLLPTAVAALQRASPGQALAPAPGCRLRYNGADVTQPLDERSTLLPVREVAF